MWLDAGNYLGTIATCESYEELAKRFREGHGRISRANLKSFFTDERFAASDALYDRMKGDIPLWLGKDVNLAQVFVGCVMDRFPDRQRDFMDALGCQLLKQDNEKLTRCVLMPVMEKAKNPADAFTVVRQFSTLLTNGVGLAFGDLAYRHAKQLNICPLWGEIPSSDEHPYDPHYLCGDFMVAAKPGHSPVHSHIVVMRDPEAPEAWMIVNLEPNNVCFYPSSDEMLQDKNIPDAWRSVIETFVERQGRGYMPSLRPFKKRSPA